jgi:septal ring factor EnvC (AmiA/AmiB activator)
MLLPLISSNYDGLKKSITMQQNDNQHLQKQITEMKKEKSMIQQHIIQNQNKLAILEVQVGLE